MTVIRSDPHDRAECILTCDFPNCIEASEPFRFFMGGQLPAHWVEDLRGRSPVRQPGKSAHFCPTHAVAGFELPERAA